MRTGLARNRDPSSGDWTRRPRTLRILARLDSATSFLQAWRHAGMADVVEVGILLADPDDFAGMNDEWARWFPVDPPARYVAKLGAVIPGVLVSIRLSATVSS